MKYILLTLLLITSACVKPSLNKINFEKGDCLLQIGKELWELDDMYKIYEVGEYSYMIIETKKEERNCKSEGFDENNHKVKYDCEYYRFWDERYYKKLTFKSKYFGDSESQDSYRKVICPKEIETQK